MTEKEIGCDNCYYSYFDERAYPCSLCIRGVERTDMWQPSRKTKASKPETFEADGITYYKTDCAWQNDEHIPTELASTMLKNRFKEQK